MSDAFKKLPDSELEIMQIIWDLPAPVYRQDIEEVLYESHDMAVTTLLTLITRLAEKGFIQIERIGRKNRYYPLVDREEYQRQQSRNFVNRVFGGNIPAFANALSSGGLSDEELETLRILLDEESI